MEHLEIEINIQNLMDLYKANDTARRVLDYFAQRERGRKETTVDALVGALARNGDEAPSRQQIIDVFKALQELGCGDFRAGRRGWKSRFEWTVDLMSVGRAASGEDSTIESVSEQDEDDSFELLKHRFQLRPGCEPVVFELPADLTENEASRLAGFVKTLPFEQGA